MYSSFLGKSEVIRERIKKTCILSGRVRLGLYPPPWVYARYYASFFYIYRYICLEAKKAWSGWYWKKKNFGSKGKLLSFQYFKKIFWKMFLEFCFSKMSQNILAYSFVSEHNKYFFYFEKKKCIFSGGGGGVDPASSLSGRVR